MQMYIYMSRTEKVVVLTFTAILALVIAGTVFAIGESNFIADIWQYAVNMCQATCGG